MPVAPSRRQRIRSWLARLGERDHAFTFRPQKRHPFPFLQLPIEIRVAVYELAIGPRMIRYDMWPAKHGHRGERPSPLLYVNKQISDEVVPLVLQRTSFYFEGITHFWGWLNRLRPGNLRHVRKLSLLVMNREPQRDGTSKFTPITLIFDTLKELDLCGIENIELTNVSFDGPVEYELKMLRDLRRALGEGRQGVRVLLENFHASLASEGDHAWHYVLMMPRGGGTQG